MSVELLTGLAFDRVRIVNETGSRAGLETTLMKNTRLDSDFWDRSAPASKIKFLTLLPPSLLPNTHAHIAS